MAVSTMPVVVGAAISGPTRHEDKAAVRWLRQWTAPRQCEYRQEKERYRRKARFCPIVQLVACSELPKVTGRDTIAGNASCRDRDKGEAERQGAASAKRMVRGEKTPAGATVGETGSDG